MDTPLTLACLRCGYSWLRRSMTKIPGTCPRCCSPYWNRLRRGEEEPPKAKPAPVHKMILGLRPLTRKQGLDLAADVIHKLQGYRKNPGGRTFENDLNFVCQVLQGVSSGEKQNL